MASPRGRKRNWRPAPRARRREPSWATLPTDALLDVRLCDLGVRLEGSPLESHVDRVLAELAQRGIRFKPHFWISDDWFAPHHVPGCAVPPVMSPCRDRTGIAASAQ